MWNTLNNDWRYLPADANYLINSDGEVRRKIDGKPIKLRPGSSHYLMVWVGPKRKRSAHLVHSQVLKAFIGERPSAKHWAAHNDGNLLNNKLSNLRWATPKENQADKKEHGTYRIGEQVGTAKISDASVTLIRFMDKTSDYTQRQLATIFKVSQSQISKIVNGEQRGIET